MRKPLAVFGTTILLTGCATQGTNTHQYSEGTPAQVKNEAPIEKPYAEVWDKLVRELSKSFYVINNIDKESRIINLSFSSVSPTDYVDCGRTVRTYTQGNRVERWDYATAGPAQFKVASDRQETIVASYYANVSRTPTLEGRANIYIAPSSKLNETVVTVNTRYLLSIKVSAQKVAENAAGQITVRWPEQSNTFVWSFNTNRPERIPLGDNQTNILCFATGKLEREILDMATK